MDIRKKDLKTLWFEDENGYCVGEPDFKSEPNVPKNATYQVSRFPTELTTTHLKLTKQGEVDNCDHPQKYIEATDGWVEGMYGRKCNKCGGTQVKKEGHHWPEKWDGTGSREVCSGTSSWPEDLALAIANSDDYFSLSEAIIIVGTSCERCMNALAFEYGLDWGYEEGSEEWEKTNTSCQFCEGSNVGSQEKYY